MKLELIQQLFVKDSCIRYLENLMDGIVANPRSCTEGNMLLNIIFCVVKSTKKVICAQVLK